MEEQMATALKLSKAALDELSDEERHEYEMRRTNWEREKQALNLQRQNVLSQKTSNPARRAALEAALTQIESQLQALS
jgi:hypothetical protein